MDPVQTPMPQGDQQNMLLGVMSYLGPLVIISFILGKDNPFVKFHVKQGLVLLVIEVAVWLIASFMWEFWMIWQLVNLGVFVTRHTKKSGFRQLVSPWRM